MWRASTEKNAYDFISWEVEKDAWIREFHNKVWDARGLDGIICPGLASPPLVHGATKYLVALWTANLFYNLLDCPVGSIPVTRVDPTLDALPSDWTSSASSSTSSSKLFEKLLYGKGWGYDANAMEGLPVGIQLVGKRWEDEKVIEMMKVVDAALGERGFGPDGWKKWKAAHPT